MDIRTQEEPIEANPESHDEQLEPMYPDEHTHSPADPHIP